MKDTRLIIPQCQRAEVLRHLHDGHQGIVKCRSRARESVWWPGLGSDLSALVNNCRVCAESRERNAEPMIQTETPKLPWQKVGVDLCQIDGADYLVVVDYLSRYPELARLTRITSGIVITHLKSIFARHGIPDVVFSDNGTQFVSSEFQCFAREYGFQHVTSSPRYPQANGEVERMVQTIKSLIKKSSDPYLALLDYRDTPGPLGKSPAELLMGRRLRTTIPLHPSKLEPKIVNQNRVRQKDRAARAKQKQNFDRRHAARGLPPLRPGDQVWVKDCKEAATVLRPANRPRSYVLRMPSGSELEQNRRFLVYLKPNEGSYDIPGGVDSPTTSSSFSGLQEEQGGNSDEGVKSHSSLPRGSPPVHVTRSGREVRKPHRYGVAC